MCGRYALAGPKSLTRDEKAYFGDALAFEPRYNVAPGSVMPICRVVDGAKETVLAKWGYIPSWWKQPKLPTNTINARADRLSTGPMWRGSFRTRRCLVLASGYFEWKAAGDGKQPYYFTTRNGELLVFAGLWDTWQPPTGDPVTTFCIVVGEPSAWSAAIHDRMPVILERRDWDRWLFGPDPGELVKPYAGDNLRAYPVSRAVNSPKNDSPQLIEPAGPEVGP